MNILLDTHLILWALYEPSQLPPEARSIIEDPDNWIYFSTLSLWECELKHIRHPDLFAFTAADVESDCFSSGYFQLGLKSRHILNLHRLPSPEAMNHKDPFDRMLITQATTDHMLFLTHDSRIREYSLPYIKYV